jgi:hypothetical protein
VTVHDTAAVGITPPGGVADKPQDADREADARTVSVGAVTDKPAVAAILLDSNAPVTPDADILVDADIVADAKNVDTGGTTGDILAEADIVTCGRSTTPRVGVRTPEMVIGSTDTGM